MYVCVYTYTYIYTYIQRIPFNAPHHSVPLSAPVNRHVADTRRFSRHRTTATSEYVMTSTMLSWLFHHIGLSTTPCDQIPHQLICYQAYCSIPRHTMLSHLLTSYAWSQAREYWNNMHIYIYTYLSLSLYMCVYIYIYAYVSMCVYIYIYTHTEYTMTQYTINMQYHSLTYYTNIAFRDYLCIS